MHSRSLALWSLISSLLCATVAWAGWFLAPPATSDANRLVFEPAEISVQATDKTPEPQRFEPRLVNRTDRTVRLKSLTAGCSCTAVGKLTKTTLAPGESILVPLEVTPPSAGMRDVTVRVETDNPGQPLVRFTIHTEGPPLALPKVVASPGRIRLVGWSAGHRLTELISIQTLEAPGSPPWIEQLDASSSDVLIEQLPTEDERAYGGQATRRTYRFRIEAGCPGQFSSPQECSLACRLTAPADEPPPPIQLSIRREPFVHATPEAIFLDVTDDPASRQRNICLESSSSQAWTLTLPDELPKGLSLEILERQAEDAANFRRLRIKYEPAPAAAAAPGTSRIEVVLRTSLAEQPLVVLPVTVEIRSEANGPR